MRAAIVAGVPLVLDSRRKSRATLERLHPGALLLDVTSRGEDPWVRFSPFFPHGGIPVPFTPGRCSASVEGIWQGLKVFERSDVDPTRFDVKSMKGLKRTTRAFGRVLGHRNGVDGKELLPYLEARRAIYVPSYRWVLESCVNDLVIELRDLARERDVVLLDYETNSDIQDLARPLSHAALVIAEVNLR